MFARYHIRSGNDSFKRTQKELFGSSSAISTSDFPCRLQNLVARLPVGANYFGEQLIRNHTIFPYYEPFLTQERRDMLRQDIMGDNGGSIHRRIGEMAGGLHLESGLRFCSVCVKVDSEKYGEPYWHRMHQLPGIAVCSIHGTYLETKCPTCGLRISATARQEYRLLDVQCLNGHPLIGLCKSRTGGDGGLTGNCVNKHFKLALDAANLIALRPDFGEPEELRTIYTSLLQQKDLATLSGRLRVKDLSKKFIDFYRPAFLDALNCGIDSAESNWLLDCFRAYRKVIHPVKHLLVMRFLSESVESFVLIGKTSYKPFGDAPWPCLNPAAGHFKKSVVQECKLSICSDTRLPVGTFKCVCGFTYSRRGPDKCSTDRYKVGRVKGYGQVWEAKLAQLYKESSSLRAKAKKMGADPGTIKKYAAKLGFVEEANVVIPIGGAQTGEKSLSSVTNADKCQFYRDKMTSVIKTHYDRTRTEIRSKAPGVYIWLYRNDREWLELALPSPTARGLRNNSNRNSRVDWSARDNQLSQEIEKAAEQLLLADEKPVRITLGKIGKSIDKLALLEQHLDKLPKSGAILRRVLESVEDFQIRRVEWAMSQLKMSGEEIAEWKIHKIAGLRPDISERVKLAIRVELERANTFDQYEMLKNEVETHGGKYQI